ncbi:MAG: hexitol phosphatase HxpB [Pantoea sp. Brub]|nr:hexitol phosphatase HxpB [Pantoea sp. Brub]
MIFYKPIICVFFDMDGLLIDSEPLWIQAEKDILLKLNINYSLYESIPDTLGLRIDQTVAMWYEYYPWNTPSQQEVTKFIIDRTMLLIKQTKPLMPGVEFALKLCKTNKFKIGLVSASPLSMLEMVLKLFNLTCYFDLLMSAEYLLYSKPHPQIYLDAANKLNINPQNCVAIEDSLNGLIATKAARMRSIVVPSSKYYNDPRWSLANIQLKNLFQLQLDHILG